MTAEAVDAAESLIGSLISGVMVERRLECSMVRAGHMIILPRGKTGSPGFTRASHTLTGRFAGALVTALESR
jgi:hypothetical protein